MLPRRFLAVAVSLFMALPMSSFGQDGKVPPEPGQENAGGNGNGNGDGWPANTGESESGENSENVPVVENPPAEGAQPDGAEGGGRQEVSGGGEVIAGGDMPADTGPDNGGLIEEGADSPKPKRKAKGKKAGAKKRKGRGAAALAAASTVAPLIPAAKLPVEVVKPTEPLPVIALSPIAPYNP